MSPTTPKHLNAKHKLFENENINLRDLQFDYVCIIAYTVLVRFSKVFSVKRGNLDIQDHDVRPFLEQGKTDIYRSGHWTYIGKVDSMLRRVKLINKDILIVKILNRKNEYLFLEVTRKNRHIIGDVNALRTLKH